MTPERKGEGATSVNRIEGTKRGPGKRNQSRDTRNSQETICYRCGRAVLIGRDPTCPAKGQYCLNADRKAISKSSARQSRKAKENKERPMAVLTPSITGIQGEALRT